VKDWLARGIVSKQGEERDAVDILGVSKDGDRGQGGRGGSYV